MEILPLFNRRLIKALQVALDHEKNRNHELLEIIKKVENRFKEALSYQSASFPTISEDGWIETYDDLGQKVLIKPN